MDDQLAVLKEQAQPPAFSPPQRESSWQNTVQMPRPEAPQRRRFAWQRFVMPLAAVAVLGFIFITKQVPDAAKHDSPTMRSKMAEASSADSAVPASESESEPGADGLAAGGLERQAAGEGQTAPGIKAPAPIKVEVDRVA